MTTLEHRFVCPLPNGLHARPASHLEAVASRFNASVVLVNERTGAEANAKSVLALIGADIHAGDPLRLTVGGSGADEAFAALVSFLRDEFAATDTPLPATVVSTATAAALPRSLQAAAPERVLRGAIACRGLAEGAIVTVGSLQLSAGLRRRLDSAGTTDDGGLALFQSAVAAVQTSLKAEIAAARGPQAEILRAHASLLGDASLADSVAKNLARQPGPVAHALMAAIAEFTETLRACRSAYLQERVLDLQDVGARLLVQLYGADAVDRVPRLVGPSLVVAESLTPGQFLALDRAWLRGLVLQHAGTTSHTVILARSFGVPTLTGVADAAALANGTPAVLDAHLGLLLPKPNDAVRRYYAMEFRRLERARAATLAFRDPPGASCDGRRLPVLANVSSAEEVAAAVAEGAEGVGLFRTEMLFMDRAEPPSEDEQAAVYSAAARAAQGRPVTLRTFDIGGDKPVPYLNLPVEANPFLGHRGARLYDEFSALLKTQLRAIFRAAAHGSVRIMAPMIACPEEMRAFRETVEGVRADFPGADVPVGMMIEVPSIAFAIGDCARHADFFSLGTNDLTQYFLAADRDNARVAPLYSAFHPSFLRLLRHIVDAAHAHNRPVGLCGELGEKAEALPVLLGLGLDSISLGAPRILDTKAKLAALDYAVCREQLDTLLAGEDRAAVEARLKEFSARPRPLFNLALIETDSDARTKHEVIKELAGLLATDARTDDLIGLEAAIWRREEAYSTGFGYGFAVPHCQSAHVLAGSIALVRLREPVEWGSLDGQPVRVVILLAMRAGDQGREHLRVFSKLSRLVMRDEFRAQLEQASDHSELLSVLQTELDPQPLSKNTA